jgi:glycosyltransferase involved in cell wall biosynthesis
MTSVKLTTVIPAYNAEGWIGRTLEHLRTALNNAGIADSQVIVVDDGSNDGTAAEANAVDGLALEVITTPNQGRFLARKTGLGSATGTHILFLDSRVFLQPASLNFVLPFLEQKETSLWTADVSPVTDGNPIARFWRAIETVFWRRYMRRPKTTSFGEDDFDYYPKGTTALIGPAELLRDAINDFVPTVDDWRKVNDDTALLRYAVKRSRINISPDYACIYNARTNLRAFMKHANHRGAVLIDGFLRPGTRLRIPISIVLAVAPLGLVLAFLQWKLAIATIIAAPLLVACACGALGAKFRDVVVLGVLFWPFSIAYLGGMYTGLWLKFRVRLRPLTARA